MFTTIAVLAPAVPVPSQGAVEQNASAAPTAVLGEAPDAPVNGGAQALFSSLLAAEALQFSARLPAQPVALPPAKQLLPEMPTPQAENSAGPDIDENAVEDTLLNDAPVPVVQAVQFVAPVVLAPGASPMETAEKLASQFEQDSARKGDADADADAAPESQNTVVSLLQSLFATPRQAQPAPTAAEEDGSVAATEADGKANPQPLAPLPPAAQDAPSGEDLEPLASKAGDGKPLLAAPQLKAALSGEKDTASATGKNNPENKPLASPNAAADAAAPHAAKTPSGEAAPEAYSQNAATRENAPATQDAAGTAQNNGAAGIAATDQAERQAAARKESMAGSAGFAKLAQATPDTPLHEQIHVQVRRAVEDGMDRISVRLSPPELGRVEVRMDVRADGQTQVVITADKPDTLELLRSDSRGLERALHDAGLKADAGGMEFNLRQQGQAPGQGEASYDERGAGGGPDEDEPGKQEAAAVPVAPYASDTVYKITEGLNIQV